MRYLMSGPLPAARLRPLLDAVRGTGCTIDGLTYLKQKVTLRLHAGAPEHDVQELQRIAMADDLDLGRE